MKFPPAFAGLITIRICEAGLLFALPLVFYRGVAEQFSTPKFFLAKCLITAGLAVWALGRIWAPPLRRARCRLGLPLLAFSIVLIISCLASASRHFSLMEVEFALCGPAWVLLLVSWERGDSAVRRIAMLIAAAGGLVAAITMLQRCGFDPVLLGGYGVDWGSMVARMRLYATLGNPNFVGGYLIGTIFAAVALAAASRMRVAKVFWMGITLAILAAIVETGSRGAWLGLAVGLAAATICVIPGNDSRPPEVGPSFASTRMFIPPAACLPLAALTFSLAERVADQLYGRVYLWRFSWPMFWQHPLAGSGWGTYQLRYLDLQAKFLAAHPEDVGYWTNNRLLHNDPLQLLLETGLLGLAAFLWVLWIYRREARRIRGQSAGGWPRYATAASVGGVTAILVDSLFNYQFAVPPTYMLLFTLLAIPTLLCDGVVEYAGGDLRAVPARVSRLRAVLNVAGGLAVIVAASSLLWQQGRMLASERLCQFASDLENHNDLASAEAAFRRSVSLNNLNGRAHFGLSRVLYGKDQPSEALEEIARAGQTYADPQQEVLRARILVKMGRNREALAAYQRALWLDPALSDVQEEVDRLSKVQ